MKLKDIYYAIGLLEGEGTFRGIPLKKGGFHIDVVTHMTDKEPLDRLQATLGGNINGPYKYRSHSKPFWTWRLGRKAGALSFLTKHRSEFSPRRQLQIDKLTKLAAKYPPRWGHYL